MVAKNLAPAVAEDEEDSIRLTATAADAEAALRSEVVPQLWPARTVAKVTQRGTYTKKGKWRSFTLDVAFDAGANETVVLTYGADTDVRRVFRRYYGDKTDVTKTRPSGRAIYAENAGCLAEVFPSDWKLATLIDALEEESILPLLISADAGPPDTSGFKAHAFRFKPHRRSLISYEVGRGSARRDFIGKLFTDDDRAQQGWDVLEQLYAIEATRDLIPRPAAFDRRLQLLVMDRMPGVMMSELLAADPESLDRQIDSAAALLASLHSVRIETGDDDARSLDTELHKIESRFETISAEGAEHVASMRELVEALKSRTYESIDEREYSFLHGDYNPRQILVDGDDLRVVDLDGGCIGDPAVDVGRFMASLRSAAVEHGVPTGEAAAVHFLNAYERLSGRQLRDRATAIMVLRILYRCERLLLTPTSENLALSRALIDDARSAVKPVIVPAKKRELVATAASAPGLRGLDSWLAGGFWRLPMRATAAAIHLVAIMVGMD